MQQITETAPGLTDQDVLIECFHCGESVSPGNNGFSAKIQGEDRPMCCPGCQAVAETICAMGLEDYYRHRTEKPARPELVPEMLEQTRYYDREAIQSAFLSSSEGTVREAEFIIEGLVCPACAWLIETRIGRIEGVQSVIVNFTDRRCRIRWDQDQVRLSEILLQVHELGYQAQPYSKAEEQRLLAGENRFLLRRLGVAGVLGMQIMMIAVALYQGEWTGMEERFRSFFHYTSLVLCIPILAYSAQPFFRGAWRDLRYLHPGMDVPVSLGLVLAFTGSVWATVSGQGTVYYDSVAMFVFFLLLGRFFEFSVRKKINNQVEVYSRITPLVADKRMADGSSDTVAVIDLAEGDTIRIKAGHTVPVDCRIIQGESLLDESVISGESMPVRRHPGDRLIAGSNNMESPLECRVTHISRDSFVSRIQKLIDSTLTEKTAIQERSNRIAAWFIVFVLTLSVLVSWYWIARGAEDWLSITIATLIITCPCALALATPVAITAMTGRLMKQGILACNKSLLDVLPDVSHVVFDKTGTLTHGDLDITRIDPQSSLGAEISLRIAAAIEHASEHPVARAFTRAAGDDAGRVAVSHISNHPGSGLSATCDGRRYFIGSAEFIESLTGMTVAPDTDVDEVSTRVVLADEKQVHCCFYLEDSLREEAQAVIQAIKTAGIIPVVMSGDRAPVVSAVCKQLGIESFHAEMKPENKLAALREMQSHGHRVVMIGDGINDGPVLAGADLSVAMGQGTDLVKNSADVIFLNNSLEQLQYLYGLVRRTRGIIRQNIGWAIAYNLLAIPAAVTGLVAPWLAALGMSLSSLAVVLNSARLIK